MQVRLIKDKLLTKHTFTTYKALTESLYIDEEHSALFTESLSFVMLTLMLFTIVPLYRPTIVWVCVCGRMTAT
jgi:hypothetical protein